MLKRCSKCGVEKDITKFYRKSVSKRGYQCWCKECFSKQRKEFYEKNKEECRDRMRKYKQTTNGKIAQTRSFTKYCQTPKGKIALARAQKKYAQTEKGKIVNVRGMKKYCQTPKGKMAMKRVMHRRRVHIGSTRVTLTLEQWGVIIGMQGNRCNICKQKFTKRRLPTVDHIIPLSKGGGLTFENVQALCRSCNSSKNAKLDLGVIQTWLHWQ